MEKHMNSVLLGIIAIVMSYGMFVKDEGPQSINLNQSSENIITVSGEAERDFCPGGWATA